MDTGTFITRDPLGFVDGPNMYAYVVQNPWTKFDPEGLKTDEGLPDDIDSLFDNVNQLPPEVQKNTYKQMATATVAGTAGVAVTAGLTLGAPEAFVVGALGRIAVAGLSNAAGSYTANATHNTISGQPLNENAPEAIAFGGILGAGFQSVGEVMQFNSVVGESSNPRLRVRHHSDNEGISGIKSSETIDPARGNPIGVHVEVGPDFGPVNTAQAETGAKAGGAFVEFDAPDNMLPTDVGARKTAVVPSSTPLPINQLNPVYSSKPWWKFW